MSQTITLSLSQTGSDVVVDWTGGVPPYRVLRSTSPAFVSGNLLLAEGLAEGPFTDVGALDVPQSFYYQVRSAGEPDPPGYEENPPRPRPAITQITPDRGPPGTVVTIDGANFSEDGSSMYVLFGGSVFGEISSSSESQLMVVVPDGALSGGVKVCVASYCSEWFPFTVTVDAMAVSFNNITSLAFEPGTGSFWIGDRGAGGVADRVYEIEPDGTVIERGQLNDPYISNVSPGDGSGRVYYGNGVISGTNQGLIEHIDSATNDQVIFRPAGGSEDPAWCRGMAANDAEFNVAYFLDGANGHVRRVPKVGLKDFNYGNVATPFTFNDPAGARFDSAGNLYVTSTTAVYKITPAEVVTEVASGFTAAAGMDLIEMAGNVFLAVADEAAGQIVTVNPDLGTTSIAMDGLDSPVAVAYANDSTGMLTLVVATGSGLLGPTDEAAGAAAQQGAPSTLIRVAPGYLEFEECGLGECKALLSKAPTEVTGDYYPNPGQDADGEIVIAARPRDQIGPGQPVYFRLRDPADPSPYVTGSEGDNLPESPGGSISPEQDAVGGGLVATTLTVAPDYSGNNYQVEASLEPSPTFTPIARSDVYTTWRRIYIENDRMLTAGSFIIEDSGAGEADPARVNVAQPGSFSMGDEVIAIAATNELTRAGEVRHVAAVEPTHVQLDAPLSLHYATSQADFPLDEPPHSFLGNLSEPSPVYDTASTAETFRRTFVDTFTDVVFIVPGSGRLPPWRYVHPDMGTDIDLEERAIEFFDHYDHVGQTPPQQIVHLIDARQWEQKIPVKGEIVFGISYPGSNVSAVFVGTVHSQSKIPENERDEVSQNIGNHEVVHQFHVNLPPPGHDEQQAWDGSGVCIMNTGDVLELIDRSDRLHAGEAAPSHDLLCIRTHVDSLNELTCNP